MEKNTTSPQLDKYVALYSKAKNEYYIAELLDESSGYLKIQDESIDEEGIDYSRLQIYGNNPLGLEMQYDVTRRIQRSWEHLQAVLEEASHNNTPYIFGLQSLGVESRRIAWHPVGLEIGLEEHQ